MVQGRESDEQKGDKDVMGKIEGMVKTPQILLGFQTERGAGRADGCNTSGNS